LSGQRTAGRAWNRPSLFEPTGLLDVNFANATIIIPCRVNGVGPHNKRASNWRRIKLFFVPTLNCVTTIDIASYQSGLVLGKDAPRHFGHTIRISNNEDNLEIIAGVMRIPIGQFDNDIGL